MGIALTAISHARAQVEDLRKAVGGTRTEGDLASIVDEQVEAIELTQSNLQRGIELVRSLKEVAANQSSSQWRAVPIRDTIETIVTTLRPTLRRAGCSLAFSCRAEGGLRTEPGAIAQILQNLILNAVNHAFEGVPGEHRIDVEVDREGTDVVIRIRDNGRGIAPDLIDTLFLPFVTSRRNSGGTGLGLHIARELATHKLKGSLLLANGAPGRTEFVLRLTEPVPDELQVSPTEPAQHA